MVSRLGEVVNVSGKTIIVQGKRVSPQIVGKIVIDKNMKNIGRVVDVFGPVDAPYAKIVLFSNSPDFCDDVLYLR